MINALVLNSINYFSILTLKLLGISNMLVGGCDRYLKFYFIKVLYHHITLKVSLSFLT
jgi:hypothetical protein